jgi:hypothetical protein
MAGRDAFVADIDALRRARDEPRDFSLALVTKGTSEVVALVRHRSNSTGRSGSDVPE